MTSQAWLIGSSGQAEEKHYNIDGSLKGCGGPRGCECREKTQTEIIGPGLKNFMFSTSLMHFFFFLTTLIHQHLL